MQPANLPLQIYKGATFRARFRVSQPTPEYRDITEIIPASPVRLTADHGLPTDWQVWIERVRQFPDLNRALNRQQPHIARVVDAQTLEISTINAAGTNAAGGQIVYYPPLPLAGATAVLTLYEKGAAAGTLAVTVDAAGWVDLLLTDEQTALIDWSERQYTLDIEMSSGDVIRAYQGNATVQAAGMAVPGTCQGFAVIGGDRGPPGPTVSAAQFDAQGRLVITLEDGTPVVTDPLGFEFQALTGDPALNTALAALLGQKTDLNDFLAFVQQTVADLAGKVDITDARLTDAREWTASEVGQPEAEAGISTTPRKWSALRVFQAAAAWWAQSAAKAKLDGIAAGATANSTDAQLRDRNTHSGTQTAATISDFNTAASAAAPVQPADLALKVAIAAIVDDLNSTSAQVPLSANQGRVIKGLLDNINTVLTSDNFSLDTFQEIVDWIEQNRATLDALGISSIAGLQAALDARYTKTQTDTLLAGKVDVVPGKQLSTESFETAEKNKLGGIAAGATVNSSDTFLRDRANHTGTQPHTTITGLGTFATENYAAAPFVNLMPDSGRFAGKMNPLILGAGTFASSPLLPGNNGGVHSSGGKFTHNNGGTLPQDVSDLLTAMGRTSGSEQAFGVEFYIDEYLCGSGTAVPQTGLDGVTRHLALSDTSGRAVFQADGYGTFVAWIRIKEGSSHARATGQSKNGVSIPDRTVFTPADGWFHFRCVQRKTIGYDSMHPGLYGLPGTKIQIACAGFFGGIVNPGLHKAPLATINELIA